MKHTPYHALVPIPDGTLYDLVERSARRMPDGLAIDSYGTTFTYSELLYRIDSAVSALYHLGVRAGEHVLLLLPNLPQSVILFYAINRLGATNVIMHPACSSGEVEEIIRKWDCSAVFVTAHAASLSGEWLQRFKLEGRRVVAIGPTTLEDAMPEKDFWRLGRNRLDCAVGNVEKSRASVVLFSGGTSGGNKAVLLSDRNLNAAAVLTAAASGQADLTGLSILAMMPMFHGFGLGVGIHTALANGATSVLLMGYSGKDLAATIRRRNLHYLPGVPTMFAKMISDPELQSVDLSSLKGVFCGGDHLPARLENAVNDYLTRRGSSVSVRQGYGLTEAVSVNLLTSYEHPEFGKIGYPLPNVLAKIVDVDTERELPRGQEGELCLSGPTVMLGYDDTELTAQTLRRHADGRVWLHTGDVAVEEESGCFRFVQRQKLVLISSGYNVYPSQIEEALEGLPFVREACVIGVPDAVKGQKIFLFLAAEAEVKAAVASHLSKRIPKYALPHRYVFLPALPRTRIGKVDYSALERLATIDKDSIS